MWVLKTGSEAGGRRKQRGGFDFMMLFIDFMMLSIFKKKILIATLLRNHLTGGNR